MSGRFTGFVNQTEMVSLSAFVRTIGWLLAFVAFTGTACALLLSGDEKLIAWGFQLALAVLGGLGVASGIGAVNTKTIRTTAKEYAPVAEAKERGKAQAEASATPAVQAETIQKVEVQSPAPLTEGAVAEHS